MRKRQTERKSNREKNREAHEIKKPRETERFPNREKERQTDIKRDKTDRQNKRKLDCAKLRPVKTKLITSLNEVALVLPLN